MDFQWDKTMGGMSFGEQADPLQKSEISYDEHTRNNAQSNLLRKAQQEI